MQGLHAYSELACALLGLDTPCFLRSTIRLLTGSKAHQSPGWFMCQLAVCMQYSAVRLGFGHSWLLQQYLAYLQVLQWGLHIIQITL